MWRYSRAANQTANIATPVYQDGKVFYTSAYDTGAALLGLTAKNGVVEAKEIYFTRNMQNHHGGVVLIDGYLYGFNNAILTCMEFATGSVLWRDRSVGKGALTYADGHLYILGEDNMVGLAVATPKGYQEKGRFQIEDRRPGQLGASGGERRPVVHPQSADTRGITTYGPSRDGRLNRRARGRRF